MTFDVVDVSAAAPYSVFIGSGTRELLVPGLAGADKVAVIHPTRLADQVDELLEGFPGEVVPVEVPDGEPAKTSNVLVAVWDRLAEAGFTRSDAIIGFGGGTTTDLAGFAAATWLRGVTYLAVPTTLLGAVDAAVGGKTGINLAAGKNLAGAFYEPAAVVCDLDFLLTLPDAELRSGMAEVIKCGFIADPIILDEFEADPAQALAPGSTRQQELIRRSVAVKASVVGDDLTERTSSGEHIGREALNYGHTLGHAIEAAEGYTRRHGEAVSIGMVFAAELAHRAGLIDHALVQRHRQILGQAGLPIALPDHPWQDLRQTMGLDKKSRGTVLRFVVLSALGQARILESADEDDLVDCYHAILED